MSPTFDEPLIQRLLQAFRQAQVALDQARVVFGQLYEAHADCLLLFLRNRLNDATVAEDIHHEVWLRAWEVLPKQFHGGNFRAWLFKIAQNLCTDHQRNPRGKKLEPYHDNQPLPEEWLRSAPGAASPEQLQEEQLTRTLRGCLNKLENEDATAALVVRAIASGRTYADICQELGIKPERAHRIFHDAKKQLRQCAERALT